MCESVPTSVSGERHAVADLDDAAQVLQVHLVADAHPGRDDAEVAEGALRPAQELVALAVALVLALDVARVGPVRPERVHLHRVVDDEVDRHQRVDPAGIGPAAVDGGAQRGQVDDGGHAGQILHEHAGRHEGELRTGMRRRPGRQGADVVLAHVLAAGPAQEVLEQHADRVRERQRVDQAVEAEERLAARERVARAEGIGVRHAHRLVRVRHFP